MESTEPEALDLESSVEQLLKLLDSLSADLAADAEVASGQDAVSGDSPAAQENQAIRLARSSIAQSRAETLAARVEEARRHTRRLVEGNRGRRARSRRSLADTVAGHGPEPAASPTGEIGDASEALRATLSDSARRLNRTRTESGGPEEMLAAIVAGAMRAVPHVLGASLTLLDRSGVITTHAPSDDLIAAVDRVQADLREGPCIDALEGTGSGMIHASDLGGEPPWPRFAAKALEAGIHEVLSFQLVTDGAAGALNLYTDGPRRFDEHDVLVGGVFADQAAVALAGARRAGELQKALATRDVIGRAKGILMERFGLDDRRAFQMLVESSQHTNMKLVLVAEWLVAQTETAHSG